MDPECRLLLSAEKRSVIKRTLIVAATLGLLFLTSPAFGSNGSSVPAGEDSLCTLPEGTFDTVTIPAGFFGSGSDSLNTVVPFGHDMHPVFDQADTFIRRLDSVELPLAPGSVATTRIVITTVALQSQAPVEVTFDGGAYSRWFDVHARLSAVPQPEGMMTIRRECDAGGSFDASLPVLPMLIFTEVGNAGCQFVFDTGLQGLPPIVLEGKDEAWCSNPSYQAPQGNGFYPTCDGCGGAPAKATTLRTYPVLKEYDRAAACIAQAASHAMSRAPDPGGCLSLNLMSITLK
ncbi:MAG: hypothetical protein GY856_13060 [bacterium]|nr:hypothetical protein [bacterium]